MNPQLDAILALQQQAIETLSRLLVGRPLTDDAPKPEDHRIRETARRSATDILRITTRAFAAPKRQSPSRTACPEAGPDQRENLAGSALRSACLATEPDQRESPGRVRCPAHDLPPSQPQNPTVAASPPPNLPSPIPGMSRAAAESLRNHPARSLPPVRQTLLPDRKTPQSSSSFNSSRRIAASS